MKKATQDNNILRIETPLGKDVLHITKAEFSEGISMPFSLHAEVYSNGQLIEPTSLIGKTVTVALLYNKGQSVSKRYFNGVVVNFRSKGSRMPVIDDGELYQDYVIEISPSLIFLTHRTNCRIFQKASVDEIAKVILDEHNVNFRSMLTKTYPTYDYKVQYHETDLSFVGRLLEQEGIFYFFIHEKEDHTLVLADDITAYTECPESHVTFTTGSLSEAHIHTWSGGLTSAPGSSVKQGYDFIKPADKPKGQQVDAELHSQQSITEVFEYLSSSEFNSRAQEQANISLESLQRDVERSSGGSNCRSLVWAVFYV